jgi:predicted transcriptional regulator
LREKRDPMKPDLYVVARFVEALYRGGPMKKTNLQMSTRLNYGTFSRYLKWFIEHDLVKMVESEEGGERVYLTSKGVETHHKLVSWIRETMENLKL